MPGEIDGFEKRSVADQEGGAGVFQLIANFPLAICRIEQRGDSSGERCGVIGDRELPGVGEEDGDHFAGSESSGDEAAGEALDQTAVFGEGEAAVAGGVDQRQLRWIVLAIERAGLSVGEPTPA